MTLANNLLTIGFTIISTINKKKISIPKEFELHKDHKEKSSVFEFSKHSTFVFYVPKIRKSIILLSTMHHMSKVNFIKNKPIIILNYNKKKSLNDTLDQWFMNIRNIVCVKDLHVKSTMI